MNGAETLKNFRLKSTPCREAVLSLFLENDHALSHAFIEQCTGSTFDRVTVYRTLRSFEERGIIHRVLNDDGVTQYALCNECTMHEHHHEHVHFKCENCGQTTCLENVDIPKLNLPVGYQITERNLLVQGVCAQCNVAR